MSLFDEVFKRTNIYEMLFFNVKSVLEFPTLEILEKENKPLYDRWCFLSKNKYNVDVIDSNAIKIYEDNACYYPEYSKIVAITYASLYSENGEIKRELKKNASDNEKMVINNFFDILYQFSSNGKQSQPEFYPILCGYNIINYEIPLLIKRFIHHNDENKSLPYMLKRILSIKPWESDIIDIMNVWKFNGSHCASLMLISDFLELKKTVNLMPLPDLSRFYWDNVNNDLANTLDTVSLQSATQTNIIMQFANKLSKL